MPGSENAIYTRSYEQTEYKQGSLFNDPTTGSPDIKLQSNFYYLVWKKIRDSGFF